MAIRRLKKNVMLEDFGLRDNPFSSIDIYNVDAQHTYVPEMYGRQLPEFYEKFFLRPLENERHRQVIGAVWSTHTGKKKWGKGFGKSILMAEESKRLNQDFGAAMLRKMEVQEEDIGEHPILSGYCTFDQSKGITSFPATLLDAVSFILASPHGESTVHQQLRSRILAQLDYQEGYGAYAIGEALQAELRKYRGLNIQLAHHTLSRFIYDLARDNTEALVSFIRHEIGPRIKATQGFNFIHVFNAFAKLAGIVYVTYFIDQIENFSRFTRQQERDIKIIREAMCQTSPTADMASFIFQMHIHAQEAIESWWRIEDLPSIDVLIPTNSGRILNLTGLGRAEEAEILASRYLADYRTDGFVPPQLLHPFTTEIIQAVLDATSGNPRDFLRTLGNIIDKARDDERESLDLTYVEPLLDIDYEAQAEDVEDEFENPVR
jgi:hypothetical protein